MGAPRTGINPTTNSVGFTAKLVTVRSVSPDGLTAVCVDRQNTQTQVPMLVQRSKGPLPQAGDTWLLTQDLGMWTFAAFVATSPSQFSGGGGSGSSAPIFVSPSSPLNPATGQLWMNTSAGDELLQWNGQNWQPLQVGTQAIADQAVTAAKVASGSLTSAQLSPSAGITAGQVAFKATDLGGTQVITGTDQPANPTPGTLWINPDQGNAVQEWNGNTWVSLQFGAGAIAPGSLTSQQLAVNAGITPSQVNFSYRDLGGLTVTIAAQEPPGPAIGDLWYDATNGYALKQWNGTAWLPYQFGTNAIAAGSVTAELIAAGTITAAQIAAGTITANLLAVGGAVNVNPYISGGDLTGWSTFHGAITAIQVGSAPYPWAIQFIATASINSAAIEGTPAPFAAIVGLSYLVSSIIYTAQTHVEIGFDWLDNTKTYLTTTTATVTVTPNTWQFISTIQAAPAGAAFGVPRVGFPGTVAAGSLLLAQAILVISPMNGGVIIAGTITAAQIAAGTITATQIQAGTITAAQLVAGIVVAGIINGTTVNAATFNGSVFEGTDFIMNSSGTFGYSGTPVAGNLIYSDAAVSGVDAFGNQYIQGRVSYLNGPSLVKAAQLYNGQLNLYIASVSIISTSPIWWQQVGAQAGTVTLESAAIGDLQPGIHIAATNSQPVWADGQLICSGGAVAANPSSVNTPETWHTLTTANGWANGTAPNSPLRYRLLPDGMVALSGVLLGASSTSTTIGTLPSGYFNPTFNEQVPAVSSAAGFPGGYIEVSTGGTLTMHATTTTVTWVVNGRFPVA